MPPLTTEPHLPEFIEKLLLLDRALQQPGTGMRETALLEKLLTLVDAVPVLLAYVDADERYRFCNQPYERWFGGPREHFLGLTVREVLGETAYEDLREYVRTALSGQPTYFEGTLTYRTGVTRTVKVDYLPHVLSDGRVAGFVSMVTDVTELRRTEHAALLAEVLRESEGRLRLALGASDLGIWDLDVKSGQLRWDDRCRELFGLPPGAPVTYEVFLQGLHPEDRARVDAAVKEAIAPGGSGHYQIEYRTAGLTTGVERWILAHGKTFFDEQRRPLRFIGTVRDITSARQAQLHIERLYEAERQSRAEAERLRDSLAAERTLLNAVLDQLPVRVAIADPSGRLVRGSAALESIWGHPVLPSEDLAWYSTFQGYHPDGRPYAPEEWPLARSLLHGEKVSREPVTLRGPNGKDRQLELSSTPVRDAEGRLVAGVVVSIDVSAHHRMQEALRREASVRDKLLGIVSHDLRNPLQAIATSGALLQSTEPLTPSQQKKVARILTSVQRMDRLIRDLLDFARVQQGGTLPIQRRPMSLEDACRPVIDELLAAHPGQQILLERTGDAQGEWDVDRMAQLVGNLVTNALKHGAAAPIHVRVDGEGPEVVLEVANQGPPIPPALLPRIFEPFTRASTGGDALKGVGLGLFIVHEIVVAHGGRISVQSTAETGTVFRVVLPRVPAG